MVSEDELFAAVNAAFEVTSRGLAQWADPHHGVMPTTNPEEYSRLTNPERWRILGARADAWFRALAETGLATMELNTTVELTAMRWKPRLLTRTDRAIPVAPGTMPLTIARSALGPAEEALLTIGAGEPAIWIDEIPDCGCDACDMGSDDVLRALDEYVFSVVSGEFRQLSSGTKTTNVIGVWLAPSGEFRRDDPDQLKLLLQRYASRVERRGVSWLGEQPTAPPS